MTDQPLQCGRAIAQWAPSSRPACDRSRKAEEAPTLRSGRDRCTVGSKGKKHLLDLCYLFVAKLWFDFTRSLLHPLWSQKSQNQCVYAHLTELRKSLWTWLREYCRQVEAEVISNSKSKLHQTMYKDFFSALYMDVHQCSAACVGSD